MLWLTKSTLAQWAPIGAPGDVCSAQNLALEPRVNVPHLRLYSSKTRALGVPSLSREA